MRARNKCNCIKHAQNKRNKDGMWLPKPKKEQVNILKSNREIQGIRAVPKYFFSIMPKKKKTEKKLQAYKDKCLKA